MRCLVPVHQEYYPVNALKRAKIICDEPVILYILDMGVLKKIREEPSYALPSYAIEEMERFIVEARKKEAMELKKKIDGDLVFVIDDYYGAIEKEIMKEHYDLLMCDNMHRRFLTYTIPVWIDRNYDIEIIGVYLADIRRIKRVKFSLIFLHELAKKIDANVCILPECKNASQITGEKMCTAAPDAIAIQKRYYRNKKSWEKTMILL